MNHIDFSKQGGFPFTQDTANFMQSDYVRALNGLATAWASAQGAQYVILSGCVQSGSNVSSGICSVNGELVYCPGGSGNNVQMVETSQSVTFENGQSHPVYITRMLVFEQGGNIPWSSFVRVPQMATYVQGQKADTAVQSATVGGAAVTKSGTTLQLPAYPTTLPANGGNANTVGNKLPSEFATAQQGGKADTAVQSATIGGTAVPKSGNVLQLPTYPDVSGFVTNQDSGWKNFIVPNFWTVKDGCKYRFNAIGNLELCVSVQSIGATNSQLLATFQSSDISKVNNEIDISNPMNVYTTNAQNSPITGSNIWIESSGNVGLYLSDGSSVTGGISIRFNLTFFKKQ